MDELTTAATLTAIAAKAIEKTAAHLLDSIPLRLAKERYEVVKFALAKGLPAYLTANYAKCETLKTLLNRNDPVALKDCFVAPDFKYKESTITSDDFLGQVSRSAEKAVITGLAGSGKSVFLKYSFRHLIEAEHSYYPIFFELRSLNRLSAKDGLLLSEIYQSIRSCCDSFKRVQFNHGLKNGAFCFLLDGFDEVKQENREQISSEITALARNYHQCAILVTSRPSNEFISWEGFSEARLLPFDLEKAVEYISKLRFDEEKKDDFLADLKGGLFEKNKGFLSNPLLAAMMLLTYDSFGEIPEKRHIFYSKCFDVLAREHDASKGRYKRELFSNLSMDELEKVFMFFCAVSYFDRQFSFNSKQMDKYVGDAISSCGVDSDITDVIRDFRESISIMEIVGLTYEFAHRSFQEYFYAKFVVTDRKLPLDEKVLWLTDMFAAEDTIEMIADMDRAYFEDEFLLSHVSVLDRKLSKIDPKTNPAGVLSKFFNRVHVGNHHRHSDGSTQLTIYFSGGNARNRFYWRQGLRRQREEASGPFRESVQKMRKKRLNAEVAILAEQFDGEIKIHHTNNRKLTKFDGGRFAGEIKTTISTLRQHLETKRDKRRRGLGALIRSGYANEHL